MLKNMKIVFCILLETDFRGHSPFALSAIDMEIDAAVLETQLLEIRVFVTIVQVQKL